MSISKPYFLNEHIRIPEPKLRFGSEGPNDIDVNPLNGLVRFGPYSRNWNSVLPKTVRIAMIGQKVMLSKMENLITELEKNLNPTESIIYRPSYLGMTETFGVSPLSAGPSCVVALPDSLTEEVFNSETPHLFLAEQLKKAISSLIEHSNEFDIVFVGLNSDWEKLFNNSDTENFNLREYLKAFCADKGIYTQLIRDDSAISYKCRASVMWRLSIALYTKLGGVPWIANNIRPHTAFIGIDYAIRHIDDGRPRFAVCCAQIFDSEGVGMEFVAFEANDVKIFGKNPYLNESQMFKIISRSLSIYLHKHNGNLPKRVIVHKNTQFKENEIVGCLSALKSIPDVELVQVQEKTGWLGYKVEKSKEIAGYPVERGSLLKLSSESALLWTKGELPEVSKPGKPYYKEGKGIPNPILLTRYAGWGDFAEVCKDTLSLTKMDWNSDGPYVGMPVTLKYAGRLARTINQIPEMKAGQYSIRLFM